jgi:hypothetical protein
MEFTIIHVNHYNECNIGYLMQNMIQKRISSFLGGSGGFGTGGGSIDSNDARGLKSALASLGGFKRDRKYNAVTSEIASLGKLKYEKVS